MTSFLDTVIDGRKISELLSGDPWTSTEAAYELLELSNHFFYGPLRHLNFYQMVETNLKRRYWAYITGIAPGSQQDKDIEGVSLLSALMFFRELGVEAENITNAIEYIWQSVTEKGELDARTHEGIMMLLVQAKEGNELAKVAVKLLRESYHAKVDS